VELDPWTEAVWKALVLQAAWAIAVNEDAFLQYEKAREKAEAEGDKAPARAQSSTDQVSCWAFAIRPYAKNLNAAEAHRAVFSLKDLGAKVNNGAVLCHVADLDGIAANLAVLDIGLGCYRYIQNHRNFFPAVGAGEEVLHRTRYSFC